MTSHVFWLLVRALVCGAIIGLPVGYLIAFGLGLT